MNVNMMYIRKAVKSRKDQKLYETKPIGSAIKFKRKQMNMTLEEAADGICSVSYLSKLENNQIEVSDQFIPPLMSLFGLDDIYEKIDDTYEDDLDLIIDHLIFYQMSSKDLVEKYEGRYDYQSELVRMGYYTLIKNDEEARKSFRDLKSYIPNFKDKDFTLFLIISNISLFKLNRFSEAFEFLSFVPKFEVLSQQLILLVLKWRLLNAFRMHRISEVFNTYPVYVNMLVDMGHYDLLQDIRDAYVQFEAYFQNPQNIKETLDKMHNLSRENRDFVIAKSLFFTQKYREVIDLSKPYYKNSSQWLVIYLMSLDNERRHGELAELLAHSDELNEVCNTSKLLISHLKYKYGGDKEQLLNYLRREILGIKHLTDEYHVLDYLMNDAQRLFSKHQHYKEAVQVTTHYLPILKILKQSSKTAQNED
ncbi:MAG: helix-turn-helix transcriptional regulator [Firmicutes bacterium]|nr:helix-turn-helix transcriptional regulator [Bacillota bacterium]